MKKAGIIGLGLIGGSLAKAFTRANIFKEIIAADLNKNHLTAAFNDGVITSYTSDIDDSFADCDVVFICASVNKTVHIAKKLFPLVKKSCIITDAGSTKLNICQELSAFGQNFIGGHPMAGSEMAGYDASTAHLFENAYYILTPAPDTPVENINALTQIINALGAIPITVTPPMHDSVVAAISHLPHIVASALVATVASASEDSFPGLYKLAAGGFKDITRIASSNPDIWGNIYLNNKPEVLHMLNKFKQTLTNFEDMLKFENTSNLWQFLSDAKDFRDNLTAAPPTIFGRIYEILLNVVDSPGAISAVATVLFENGINIKNIGIINNREYEEGVLQIILEDDASRIKATTLLRSMGYDICERNNSKM